MTYIRDYTTFMGNFATVDGRYGQITSVRAPEKQSNPVQFKLRWLDDTTESEWLAKEKLQQIVGSRLALTDDPATAVDKSFVSTILIPTPGRYTSDLRVQLSLPLKTRATAEVRHQIGLRTLRRICVSEMEAQRAAMETQQAETMRMLQAMQEQLDAMRREQGAMAELRKELAVLHRWHVEPLVYGRGCLGSAPPCSRDHPEVASSLQFAALQVALPQISDAGIRALWEAGMRSWSQILSAGEADGSTSASLGKLLGEADAAALHTVLHPVSYRVSGAYSRSSVHVLLIQVYVAVFTLLFIAAA
jgi:hypothetical protein